MDAHVTLPLPIITFFVFAFFGGYSAGMKKANSSPRGFWFWTNVPLITGLAMGLTAYEVATPLFFEHDCCQHPWSNAPYFAVPVALIAFTRLGGFSGFGNWARLRKLIARGQLLRDTKAFHDHPARLNLLQKVGPD